MEQKKGLTNAREAILSCIRMFQNDNRNCARCIILFTDGDVNIVEEQLILLEKVNNIMFFIIINKKNFRKI